MTACADPGIDHAAHQIDGRELLQPPVNEVAHKQCLSPWVAPDAACRAVTELLLEQRFQCIRVTMNVTNHVVIQNGLPSLQAHEI